MRGRDPDSQTVNPAEAALIRASELVQYSFCRRAWWLSMVKGLPSRRQAALNRGIQSHQRHADQVQTALRWQQASVFLFLGGIILLIVVLILVFTIK